jgi:8-oxo-dGTP pyrophosphatase MutT (NUDIX family)
MPGAMVALRRDDGQILFTQRADDGTWCLPAGAAEIGGSFARTALVELSEEAGVEASKEDLVPFGCLSEAELHTLHYPSGDLTHCFALCFLVDRWSGDPRPDGEESTAIRFAPLAAPPRPLHEPSALALGMLAAYLKSSRFQVR